MGGLSRRATVIERLRSEGPVVVVDGGDLFWKSASLPSVRLEQQKIKAALQAEAYALSGLDAFVPGPGDLAIGLDAMLEIVGRYELPLIAANLTCGGRTFDPSVKLERGGRTIGVIGVTSMPDGGACESGDAVAAIQTARAEMGDVDVLLLITNGDSTFSESVAAGVPDADFILNGHARMTLKAPRRLEGGAWLLGAGSRGKMLGVLEMRPRQGAEGWRDADGGAEAAEQLDRYRERMAQAEGRLREADSEKSRERAERQVDFYRKKIVELEAELAAATATDGSVQSAFVNALVDLDGSLPDHAPTQALVEAALTRIEAAAEAPAALGDTPFAGSAACKSCHPGPYAQWSQTPHANAWGTLIAEKRQMDQACYSCHVTGAFHAEGPKHPAQVPEHLTGVGCESCHGAQKAHASDPAGHPASGEVSPRACTQCHDGVQDEGRFEYASYLEKVVHGSE